MSFRLTSQISIGNYAFSGGVNEVKIERSTRKIIDTAKIKIPAAGRVSNTAQLATAFGIIIPKSQADTLPVSSVATSTLWKEGDPVNILLGYNNDYRQEFKGFVRRITASTPALIECEGYAWQLRRKQFLGSFGTIQLREFLTQMIAGTDIKLSPFIPSVPLSNITVRNGNALEVLKYITDKMHLFAYFQLDTLYVGLEEAVTGNQAQFRLGWNVVRDDKLKWRNADTTNALVRVYPAKGKNKKTPVIQVGDEGGSIINEHIAGISDPATLSAIANRIYLSHKYTGYEGSITGFLQPQISPADTAVIIDKMYNERQGNFFVEGIEIEFGMNGGRRVIHIGRSLSVPNSLTGPQL